MTSEAWTQVERDDMRIKRCPIPRLKTRIYTCFIMFSICTFLVLYTATLNVGTGRSIRGNNDVFDEEWDADTQYMVVRKTLQNKNVPGSFYDDSDDIYLNNYTDIRQINGYNKEDFHVRKHLPQAIIIGVKKSGTRALLEFIRLHPDIRAPGPEIHFFDRNYEKGLAWYRQRMPASLESQITVEKTPSYFVTKDVPRRIFKMNKHSKLILVVRDPVTRAISDYAQSKAKRPNIKPFEELVYLNGSSVIDTAWGAIKIGFYAKHLEQWLKYFPKTQIHFVSGEQLVSNPAGEITKVQDFLGLKRIINEKHFYFNKTKGFPCLKKHEGNANPHCFNSSKGRKHPSIDPKVIQRLREFYRPFNAKFYEMTDINFNWP